MDMDSILSQRLTQYIDCLLDDSMAEKSTEVDQNGSVAGEITERQNKKKKKKKDKTKAKNEENQNVPPSNESKGEKIRKKTKKDKIKDTGEGKKNTIKDTPEEKPKKTRVSEGKDEAADKGFTDDGFKIVSSIPIDDSDVSDAFESCNEEWEEEEESTPTFKHGRKDTPSSRKPKETDDGFKIVTEIPPDDSDISDAFEEDDNADYDGPMGTSSSTHMRQPIKKPIMQIMNDFGIDDKTLLGKKETTPLPLKLTKKQKKLKNKPANTQTLAAKRKKQEDVQVFDYAKKRGANKKPKKEKVEEVVPSSVEEKPETLDEKQLKRVRYDVFRLGMSGFHKEKKEDTRVALVIKLGAKPPRKKAVNYKKLQEMKKVEKKTEAEEKEMKLKLGLKVPKPFKKKERPVVKAASAQIGRYRHGVQVVSKRDIHKISKSR